MKGDEKMKTVRKILAIILVILTLISIMSVATPVFAAEVTEMAKTMNGTTEIVSEEQNLNDAEKESEILYEDISRRDEYTKHFVMNNGLRRAVKYSQPIHYKEKGEWVNIDNTLEYNKETEKYENKANSFKVKFDKNFESEELFSIENEGYTMSWKYSGNSMRNDIAVGKVEKHSNKKDKAEKHELKPNGKIKYDKFESDCNLEYIVTGTGVKENIILESYTGKNKFSFEVTAKNLGFIKNEDKSLSVVNQSGEEIFYIPAPFMYDADSNYCYDVDYLIETPKDKTIISVIADKDWLEDKETRYPVTIDPVIETEKTKSAIETTFVASGTPTTNYNGVGDIYIGVDSYTYDACRTLVKFELPTLKNSDMVVGATLGLWMYDTSFYLDTMPDKQINVHTITTEWDIENVTWNTKPKIAPNASDYNFIKKSDASYSKVEKGFDVTRTVKEWYEGTTENNGFLIKAAEEDGSYSQVAARAVFRSDNYENKEYMPYIAIEYRNNKGIESYWNYSNFGVGVAGIAYVNDYTGNLVYELPIASSISEIMPIDIVAYYNNYCAHKLICETQAENVRTSIGRGFRLFYQQTVLPSSEYIESETFNEKYPYVYTDGDGTEHYIQKVIENEGEDDEKTVYKDEDGLGLTLETGLNDNDEVYYKITDKAHNTYYFNLRGNLSRIKDTNGNEMQIIYKEADSTSNLLDRSRIDKIIDGAGHTYTFAYAVKSSGVEMDYVKTITDDAGRVVDFDISSGLLTKVKYPNSDVATFEYQINSSDPTDRRINAIYSNEIYGLKFVYSSLETGRRVKKVTEYGESSVQGQVITFNRSKYNTTIMRSCGMDGVHGNNDDIITTVQYDNMGRAISQQMKFGSGTEISAGSCAYTTSDSDDSASGFKNKVSGSGASGKFVENLLYGGNAESTSGWNFTKSGTITASEGTSSASRYIGKKSIKLTVDSVGSENARCYFRQNYTDNIKSNTEYTLSAYVKTGDLEAKSDATLTGAFIQIIGYDSSGNAISTVNSRSQILRERTDLDVNKGWRRLNCTVKTNSDVVSLRCYLFLRNTKGSVCFDGIQLEKGATVNDYNMLENAHFTMVDGNVPRSWNGTSRFEFEANKNGVILPSDLPEDPYYDDIKSKTLIITGSPNVEKGVTQTVSVEGNPEDTYILSGWAKGFPVNSTYHTSGSGKNKKEIATFEIAVKVIYSASDGSSPEQFKTPASFNTTITDWQCACVPISLKYTGGEKDVTYTPQSIKIIPRYNNQVNFVFFDKIMLVKDVASSYTYDEDGNLVSASSNSEQKANMKYDDNDNLTSYTDSAGFKTELTYDEKNNINYTRSAKGVYTNYGYDEKGNITRSDIRNKGKIADATAVIKTETAYYEGDTSGGVTINEGAYHIEDYDQNGNKTIYGRDHRTGTLTSVTDANNVITNYEYYLTNNNKNFGKQKSVATSGSKVTYNYNVDTQRLESIVFGTTKQETYSFEYDVFGNITQTKVGWQPLSTNTFGEHNGVLEKTEYGNGDFRRYSYNNFGQKIVDYVTDDGTQTKAYSWAYNDSGVNIRHTDYVIGLQYLFDYDSLGRISKEEVKDYNTGEFVGYTEYGYDVRNNLTKLITNYGGKANKQQYFYTQVTESINSVDYQEDNLPTMYKLNDGVHALYRYDGLNRLNQRKLVLGENTNLYYNYIYKLSDRNAENETKYKTNQVEEEYIGNDVYIYGYDEVGNITSIRTAERKSTNYDSTDFKEYENDDDYVTYSYDDLGQLRRENIAGKYTYAWSYDELGNIAAKNEYAYTTDVDLAGKTATKTVTYYYKEDDIPYEIEPETTKTYSSWNNLLLAVNLDGSEKVSNDELIVYDEIGNPKKYLGADLAWNGRQLTSYTKGDTAISYTYDSNGLRTSKTVNGVTSKYFYVNGNLHYEERSDGTKLYFFYDSTGNLTGIEHNNTIYYPATNQRGDVVAIYNSTGECVAKYEYDAWGKVIGVYSASKNDEGKYVYTLLDETENQTHIAIINPIRYRGYYFDTETKFYYLQSRYYNPEIGRFLNSDSISDSGAGVLGFNTFIYCANNPVNASDPSGHGLLETLSKILDTIASFFTSDIGIKIAEASDKKNGTNKTPILKKAGIVQKATGNALSAVELTRDACTAASDWCNHTDNILGYGMYGDAYTPKPLSENYSFSGDYQEHCTQLYTELNNYAPLIYNTSLSQLDETGYKTFRKNLLSHDPAYAKQFYIFYGEEITKVTEIYIGSGL